VLRNEGIRFFRICSCIGPTLTFRGVWFTAGPGKKRKPIRPILKRASQSFAWNCTDENQDRLLQGRSRYVLENLLFLGLWSFDYDANVQTPPSPWGAWIILVSVQAWRPGSHKSSLIQIRFGGRSVVYSVSDTFLRGRKCRGSQYRSLLSGQWHLTF